MTEWGGIEPWDDMPNVPSIQPQSPASHSAVKSLQEAEKPTSAGSFTLPSIKPSAPSSSSNKASKQEKTKQKTDRASASPQSQAVTESEFGKAQGSIVSSNGRSRSVPPNDRQTGTRTNWNQIRPKPQAASVSEPNDDEKKKRAKWAKQKRLVEEKKLKELADRAALEEAKRRELEQQRLDARRAAIRERIVKQQEIHAKMLEERQKAVESIKQWQQNFKGKPFHERVEEEYQQELARLEAERKHRHEENVQRMKTSPYLHGHSEDAKSPAYDSGDESVIPDAPAPPPKQRQRSKRQGRSKAARAVSNASAAAAAAAAADDADDIVDESPPAVAHPYGIESARKHGHKLPPLLIDRASSPLIGFSAALAGPPPVLSNPKQSKPVGGKKLSAQEVVNVTVNAEQMRANRKSEGGNAGGFTTGAGASGVELLKQGSGRNAAAAVPRGSNAGTPRMVSQSGVGSGNKQMGSNAGTPRMMSLNGSKQAGGAASNAGTPRMVSQNGTVQQAVGMASNAGTPRMVSQNGSVQQAGGIASNAGTPRMVSQNGSVQQAGGMASGTSTPRLVSQSGSVQQATAGTPRLMSQNGSVQGAGATASGTGTPRLMSQNGSVQQATGITSGISTPRLMSQNGGMQQGMASGAGTPRLMSSQSNSSRFQAAASTAVTHIAADEATSAGEAEGNVQRTAFGSTFNTELGTSAYTAEGFGDEQAEVSGEVHSTSVRGGSADMEEVTLRGGLVGPSAVDEDSPTDMELPPAAAGFREPVDGQAGSAAPELEGGIGDDEAGISPEVEPDQVAAESDEPREQGLEDGAAEVAGESEEAREQVLEDESRGAEEEEGPDAANADAGAGVEAGMMEEGGEEKVDEPSGTEQAGPAADAAMDDEAEPQEGTTAEPEELEPVPQSPGPVMPFDEALPTMDAEPSADYGAGEGADLPIGGVKEEEGTTQEDRVSGAGLPEDEAATAPEGAQEEAATVPEGAGEEAATIPEGAEEEAATVPEGAGEEADEGLAARTTEGGEGEGGDDPAGDSVVEPSSSSPKGAPTGHTGHPEGDE